MKILVVADTPVPELQRQRLARELVEGIDLVLSCGDLPPEYLTMLRNRLGVPLFYVMGNHDIRYHSSPPVGCTEIHRRIVKFGGLRILGLGGSRWYNGGPNQYQEGEMRKFIARLWFALLLNRGVDMVVTHAPPRGVGDAEDPCHKGFRCFRRLIKRHRPGHFIHGHIHAHFASPRDRLQQVGTTTVINSYGYHVFEIEMA